MNLRIAKIANETGGSGELCDGRKIQVRTVTPALNSHSSRRDYSVVVARFGVNAAGEGGLTGVKRLEFKPRHADLHFYIDRNMARRTPGEVDQLPYSIIGRRQKPKRLEAESIPHREIVDYWTLHQSESGLSVDWAEAEKLCWRCAQPRRLQRCHIVPHALGGKCEPENLVLLCGQCHAEAPNVDDPQFMWTWLRAHATQLYGLYWYMRGMREYELVYGRKFQDEFNPGIVKLESEIHASIGMYLKRTNTHWGQGKINPATIAWLLRQIVCEYANRQKQVSNRRRKKR